MAASLALLVTFAVRPEWVVLRATFKEAHMRALLVALIVLVSIPAIAADFVIDETRCRIGSGGGVLSSAVCPWGSLSSSEPFRIWSKENGVLRRVLDGEIVTVPSYVLFGPAQA